MNITLTARLSVSEGTTERHGLQVAAAIDEAEADVRVSGEIAAAASNVAVWHASLTTGQALLLKCDGILQVRLNATDADPITCAGVLLLHGEFTALYLSNASAAAVAYEVLLAGV
jgi:hypothetical protein